MQFKIPLKWVNKEDEGRMMEKWASSMKTLVIIRTNNEGTSSFS